MTRKDRLYKNVQKMQQEKGIKNFNFIPTTFLLPYEFEDFSGKQLGFFSSFFNLFFSAAFQREKGIWIIKPVASSQGKGIFLINHVKLYFKINLKEKKFFIV
jgi:tubulin polyglutamylase TTLL5